MHIELVARRFNLPDEARDGITARVEELAEIGIGITDATLHIEEHGSRFSAEVTLTGKRVSFHAETNHADSVSHAIDAILGKAEKQIRRHKDRLRDSRRRPKRVEPMPDIPAAPDIPAEPERPDDDTLTVIAEPELFSPKPMSVEEAAMQLDLSDATFLTFRNAQTREVNVVYYDEERGAVGWVHP